MSQFAFLAAEFLQIHALALRVEGMARSDARGACFYARLTLETMVDWLYRHEANLRSPYESTLSARIHEPTFKALVGAPLLTKARALKDLGNRAAHESKTVPAADGVAAARELFHLSYWLVRTYARGEKPSGTLTFSADALPLNLAVPAERLDQLNAAAARFVEAVRAREAAEAQARASDESRATLEAELAQLRAEVAAAKAANTARADDHDYNEAATRDLFIDLLLREAGWSVSAGNLELEVPVTGMPNSPGQGFVDYVLRGDDGKPLAVVEAKRTKKDPRVGQRQAELYADCLEAESGQRPIVFYTNGYEHWIWDDRRYPPRAIQGFLTKDELELAIRRRTTLRPLSSAAIDAEIAGRYYQTRAIRRVAETFEKDKQRRALLVMATGSGKTRTVIALADLLMKANWARRILFLADRKALVNQAAGAFKKFLPSASPVNLISDRTSTGRVYVSTYPTMMGLIDGKEGGEARRFGPGHFDLIVIDEAHRSVYRKYGAIFDYFDSLLVGLTATPKNEIDRDTYGLFNLQRGVPTDAYDLDEAVGDKFLVPPKAVAVPLRFEREGIRYDDLPEDEQEAWDAVEWDEDGNVPAVVEPAAVNKWLFNADTVDKVLEHLMTHGQRVADGDRLGKTIIFAKNQDHARFIVERFDLAYPNLKGSFARVVISGDSYSQTLIDDFSQPDKAPHIAVSVDMLDTGIDVPEVVNLVFFKIVRSKAKFWQMIGRGTRLCPDLFGPGVDKAYFSVFDFCQNLEFFNQNPDVTDGALGASLSQRLFAARVELIGALDGLHPPGRAGVFPEGQSWVLSVAEGDGLHDEVRTLREDLASGLRDIVGGMSLDNFLVRPKRRLVEKYAAPEAWSRLGLDDQAELIHDLAGLPSSVSDDDIAAKQFDALILRTQLSVLRAEASFAGLRDKIVAIANLLEEKGNIPMVAKELAFIQEVQSDDYWQDVTAPMLEVVRRRLRALIKLIEIKKRPIIRTDFEDEIGAGTEIELRGTSVGADMDRFRRKAQHFLQENASHLAILKLRRNVPLTPTDLLELERIFVQAGVAEPEDIVRLQSEGGLGLFIRSLVGLDREAAKEAFAAFMEGRALSASQIEFLNTVIDHLTERGQMDPGLLYESPFTDFNPLGVSGLFSLVDTDAVIAILDDVKKRAAA
ncbi:DEAD/DEAH box helicase family protein [Phenylobacterium sp.]|uniref:DEAD/DEAH box helicase family protein n=1 Tax=Phenylobacterium sp. TaxID=1871053 RepID=UPI0027318D40|nr:DEAD/DEAH box helicase family protein [Phenylobacterium sp.]MDP1598714.1 DEAD/DEAH box helicase family protein [Phenylobacterium sp.]